MSCARIAAALLLGTAAAFGGGINTDAALRAGRGETISRTKARHAALEQSVESYLLEQTVLHGVTPNLTLFANLGYAWTSPGPDGLTDLLLRGRYTFLHRDEKRATLSLAALAGVEVPVGEEPIGSPDGGYRLGVVGTWERHGWRVDADLEHAWRPNAPDLLRADVALVRNVHETDRGLWQAVLELNFSRRARADVLFLSPGAVFEIPGWKFEASLQIAVATDVAGPAPEYAAVLSVVHVF